MTTITQLPTAIAGTSADALVIAQSDGQTHQITPSSLTVYATGSATGQSLAAIAETVDTLSNNSGGSYAALNGSASETFEVADAASSTEAVPLGQAKSLFAQLGAAETFTKSQSSTIQALTYGTTITPDLTQGNDLAVTLTGNATLANPSALTPGTSGHLLVTQDSTGGRTMAFGSYYNFGSAGVPTLSTAAGASDIIIYWVASTTAIVCAFIGGV